MATYSKSSINISGVISASATGTTNGNYTLFTAGANETCIVHLSLDVRSSSGCDLTVYIGNRRVFTALTQNVNGVLIPAVDGGSTQSYHVGAPSIYIVPPSQEMKVFFNESGASYFLAEVIGVSIVNS